MQIENTVQQIVAHLIDIPTYVPPPKWTLQPHNRIFPQAHEHGSHANPEEKNSQVTNTHHLKPLSVLFIALPKYQHRRHHHRLYHRGTSAAERAAHQQRR